MENFSIKITEGCNNDIKNIAEYISTVFLDKKTKIENTYCENKLIKRNNGHCPLFLCMKFMCKVKE